MMNMTCSPPTKLCVYPAKGMPIGPLISSCPAEKASYFAALKLMTGLLGWEATSHSMPGGQLFPWEELLRSSSRIDVLEWYIEIANEKNLSLVDITLFPVAVDHGSLTLHTIASNIWSLYIDRLKAEAIKGKKKYVNPILARCLSIIHCLVSNYLNGGDNVESHALRPRKRERINPMSLVPISVFIESSINGSSKEIH
jgi:hypothetical protein